MKELPHHAPVPALRLLLLAVIGLDLLLYGGWAVFLPEQLFGLLQLPLPHDALLWRVVGLLLLAHIPCVVQAAIDPDWTGILLAPALARLLLGGVWLWLLFSPDVTARSPALLGLLGHDLIGSILLLALMQALPARRSA